MWALPHEVKAQNQRIVLDYQEPWIAGLIQSLGWQDTLDVNVISGSFKWMNTLTWALANEGYLAAHLTKIHSDSAFETYNIQPGKCYRQVNIQYSEDLKLYGAFFSHGKNVPFKPSWLQNQVDQIITQLENNGYPYAMIESRVLVAGDSTIDLSLTLNKGALVIIDSIILTGNANLHPAYLASYLGIRSGDPYAEKRIRQIDALLDRLTMIKRTGNTQVVMLKNSAVIKIFADKRNTDRLDGIIGFAPNSTLQAGSGILFTGEVNFALQNLLGRGIETGINWRKYLAASQDLNMSILWPFVLNSPLYVGADGYITRFDSLFIDTKINWKVGVFQQGNRQMGVVVGRQNTSLITADTAGVRKSARLPVNNPMEIYTYGLHLKWNQTDHSLNPRSGFKLSAHMAVGTRTLKRDPGIDKVIFYSDRYPAGISIYDTLDKKSLRGEILMDHTFFIPTFSNTTLALRYMGNYLLSEKVYVNELYRLGGFSTLQGFDERAIFANAFSMFKTEFRYLLSEESFAGVFVNAAFTENRSEQMNGVNGWLYGAGANVQLNTGRSSLQMAYALGTSQGEPIALRNAKFHFGLINYLR